MLLGVAGLVLGAVVTAIIVVRRRTASPACRPAPVEVSLTRRNERDEARRAAQPTR
jgi:hypothetical protein